MMDLKTQRRLEEESSLEYWYPKIEGQLPTPRTEIVPISMNYVCSLLETETRRPDVETPDDTAEINDNIRAAAARIGYPVFIRTDQASAKHDYALSCVAESPEDLQTRLYKTIEHNELAGMCGLPYRSVVVREYLRLVSFFKAFAGLPIAVERRYFVEDGKVVCHHPYWDHSAVKEDMDRRMWVANHTKQKPDIPDHWEEKLADMNTEGPDEIEKLTRMAEAFSRLVPGYWSVDFALTEDRGWVLIDAARGLVSWHPEECPSFRGEREEKHQDESENVWGITIKPRKE